MLHKAADLVQEHRRPALAALQLRDEVMAALRRVRRDRPEAERADRAGFGTGFGVVFGHGFRYRKGRGAKDGRVWNHGKSGSRPLWSGRGRPG